MSILSVSRLHRRLLAAFLAFSLLTVPLRSQDEPVDLAMVKRIREEAFERSDVMSPAYKLTREIGPRLTGSANLEKALQWCGHKLVEDGLTKVRLEQWGPFERAWSNEGVTLRWNGRELAAIAGAWTPGTNGMVRGRLVHVTAEERKHLSAYKGKLKGALVLWGKPPAQEAEKKEPLRRLDSEMLERLRNKQPKSSFDMGKYRKGRELWESLREMMKREGALALVLPSPRANSLVAYHTGARAESDQFPAPMVIVSQDDFAKLAEAAGSAPPAEVELDVRSSFQPAPPQYNLFAEIEGTDKKDELVMVGAHLDSVHVGAGATDNAAGVSVVMEAVRLLQKLGVKPRRTILVALWTGEEQGLYGSRLWVNHNLAELTGPNRIWAGPKYQLVSAYYNVDNGAGRLRGIYTEGNDRVRPIFERWMEPLKDLGVDVASPWSAGGTDHYSFDVVGVPAFQFVQDPMEYFTLTHHATDDTFDKLDVGDLQQASAVLAVFLYHTAMRDAPLPRRAGLTVRLNPNAFK